MRIMQHFVSIMIIWLNQGYMVLVVIVNENKSAFSHNGFLNRKYINSQYFLKVPRHMRRRAVAHDVMRLPRRLRYDNG